MIKHLSPHGNSLALVIDKGILSLLNITEKTPLEVTTDGRALFVAPAIDVERKNRVKDSLAWVNRRYGKALKKLAEPDK
jgi:antitoxin component of MazEF toxin-antitoxin module